MFNKSKILKAAPLLYIFTNCPTLKLNMYKLLRIFFDRSEDN